MGQDGDSELTVQLLRKAAGGDEDARDLAWSRVHEEVLKVAGAQRRRWSGDWTLETRVLTNEVFLKLYGRAAPEPNDRKHFFTLVSKAVRQILVNYSEARRSAKRGGEAPHVTLVDGQGPSIDPGVSEGLLELHDALERFLRLDPRAAQVVELRFFGGLNYDEIANTLGISRATAVRDWEAARKWLNRELSVTAKPSLRMGDPGSTK